MSPSRERREHREPGAEHDRRLAARGVEPCGGARDVFEAAVHQREPRLRKSVAEARFELRRQADLGHQHERLRAALEHVGDECR